MMISATCTLAIVLLSAADSAQFVSAKPVWPEGREKEKNLFVGFRAIFDKPQESPVILRCTGSTVYRAFVNGTFCGYGPARAAHGYFRVDEWNLTPFLKDGKNIVAIEVAGYNANSYYLLDQPSFLQAEVVAGATLLAATGHAEKPIDAAILKYRLQKVQRYSFQRPFSEVYRLTSDSASWRIQPDAAIEKAPCTAFDPKPVLARRVPYPLFDSLKPVSLIAQGTMKTGIEPKRYWKDRSLTGISDKLGGYPENELEVIPSLEMQRIQNENVASLDKKCTGSEEITLSEKQFVTLDFGANRTGFPALHVSCSQPARLFVLFDEMLREGDVDWKRLGCVNLIDYEFAPGDYDLLAFEPYTLRYMKLLSVSGSVSITNTGLRIFENPDTARAEFAAADPRLEKLFEAGRSTFAQNALDVFMDCPHRERAGWLCDSFFTARSAKVLSGNTVVEHNFVENFLLPDHFEYLPEGMLPMCYPSDHNDGVFIPNWALWFVVQLGEYSDRSGDHATVDALKPRVLALFDYFKKFKNSDGLLEKLQSWVFVEWSKANDFVQDVNYPSNMLYAGALSTAARLYNLPDLEQEARAIRETIQKQSFDGTFFVDNALRKDSRLEVTKNRSEVCQYFAFFFNVASPETHAELWAKLQNEFGPKRKESGAYKEIYEANSFVGNMLRLELLSRYGRCQQILDESIEYLLYMADRTGTLWENVGDYASLNHGFASHITNTLYRDVLGVESLDSVNKQVHLRFTQLNLSSCKGQIPIGDDVLKLTWTQDAASLRYSLSVPDGYQVTIDNQTGKQLVKE
ncbi:MAG TPA: hypothetical protein PLI09_24665 [Candidatus Hydrogenedentes bacterium]|nr:hypothetical protein [Candidatus Hydrogenedentota bacterium]